MALRGTNPLMAVADVLLMLRLILPKLSVSIPPSRIPMLSRKLSNTPMSRSGMNGRMPCRGRKKVIFFLFFLEFFSMYVLSMFYNLVETFYHILSIDLVLSVIIVYQLYLNVRKADFFVPR